MILRRWQEIRKLPCLRIYLQLPQPNQRILTCPLNLKRPRWDHLRQLNKELHQRKLCSSHWVEACNLAFKELLWEIKKHKKDQFQLWRVRILIIEFRQWYRMKIPRVLIWHPWSNHSIDYNLLKFWDICKIFKQQFIPLETLSKLSILFSTKF